MDRRSTSSSQQPVKSADRVIDVLEYICERGNAASHSEIAGALSIPKGSLSKLLGTLVRRRYVSFDERSARYSVGEGITRLYERSQQMRQGPELALPI